MAIKLPRPILVSFVVELHHYDAVVERSCRLDSLSSRQTACLGAVRHYLLAEKMDGIL